MANGNLKDMSVLFNTETSQQGVIAYKVFLDTEPSVCVYLWVKFKKMLEKEAHYNSHGTVGSSISICYTHKQKY